MKRLLCLAALCSALSAHALAAAPAGLAAGGLILQLRDDADGPQDARRQAFRAASSAALPLAGKLGGRVGIAPRIYLKKLVADVLDRVDQYADFDPLVHYTLTLSENELTPVEREAAGARGVDDISLEL